MAPSRLIDPQVLGRVCRLELVARQAVEGFLSGRHPSPYYGSSVEYADHRPYTLGDEIRAIDWKLLAKTDKHYIKLYAEQTNTRCMIVVDGSASMGFRGEERGRGREGARGRKDSGAASSPQGVAPSTSKLDYALQLALALAYLLIKQNDAVGMAMIDRELRHFLPPRATASHFRTMVDILDAAKPSGDSKLGPVLHELAGRFRKRGLIILISDLLDDPAQIADALAHFRFLKHEVLVFHVMDPDELEFPYEKLTRFKDIEGFGTVVTNPRTVRQRYLDRLNAFLTEVRRSCLERGVSYELARTDTPYEQMLSAFLERRARMKG